MCTRLLLLLLLTCACNLSATPARESATYTPAPVQPAPAGQVTRTPISDSDVIGRPTATPRGGQVSATSIPALGVTCEVYTTYSGVDPNNKLSLRAAPSASAMQVFRVPNNAEVYRVPDTQEIEAEGFHWVIVIYVETAQQRYQGWIARDSYTVNGVRNPAIATLRQTGRQAGC